MAIIGIAGKIGSGKDTVGKCIQYLTSTANEKWTFVEYLERYDLLGTIGYGYLPEWEIKKFAGKLKQVASLLTGIPVEKFEDQEFKKTYLPECWSTWYPNQDKPEPMSVREFLQKLGTEAMRDRLHTNVWVNALMSDYTCLDDTNRASMGNVIDYSNCEFPKWILTDLRFPNEYESVIMRGGITIKVTRPGTDVGTHTSETALDNHEFNYIIVNDGTLEELVSKVKDILVDLNIIHAKK